MEDKFKFVLKKGKKKDGSLEDSAGGSMNYCYTQNSNNYIIKLNFSV